jgi:hypothetical protein
MRSIHLNHLTKVLPPLAPLPVRTASPLPIGNPCVNEPLPESFDAYPKIMLRRELFMDEGRTMLSISPSTQGKDALLDLRVDSPIGFPASRPMTDTSISPLTNTKNDPPYLPFTQS